MWWGSRVTHGRSCRTPKELEAAIKRRLLDAGVAEKNIDIADRGVLDNPIFLNATALVNVRPVRTHHWAGVGTCLKNYIQFVPNPSGLPRRRLLAPGQNMDLPHCKGKDPPEYPLCPHAPILWKGSQFLRQEIRLAL